MTAKNAATRAASISRSAVSTSPIIKWAGPISMAAAGLIVASQILGLVLGLTAGSNSVATLTHTLEYIVALLALYALLLALTGLYVRQTKAVGKLGFVGYLVAFLGTLLVAGDWWYEAFVGPQLATRGLLAELYEVPFSEMGSLMVGAFVTFGLFSLGWILFGIATLRGRFFGVGPAILLIVGGAVGVMAGTPGSQIPLAIAIGWMGYLLNTSSRDDDTAA